MRVEVKSAANFLTNLLRVKCGGSELQNLDIAQLERFCSVLEDALCLHYAKHWFPEKPFKGSGYRCIRINHKMDPILLKAGCECGFDEVRLRRLFPDELTMWIDPREVSYRIGENGSICVLFDAAQHWESSPPRPIHRRGDASSSDDDSCSPMSMSPPSPTTCKRGSGWDSFIMDPRNNMNYHREMAAYVSS